MFRELRLRGFALALWIGSVIAVAASFLLFGGTDILTLIASLIGVTALIYVARGHAMGQLLTIVFAVFYGIISYSSRYYGEMITYLGMTAPTAAAALVAWLRHPYRDTAEVEVSRLSKRQKRLMVVLAVLVTTGFYFILGALGNASLAMSTVSVTTSFLASYLTVCRSPFYALAYAANDIVLIALWVQASLVDISSVPMVACFVMFFTNDMYGFVNWRRMMHRQKTTAG
ncbi:MAG: nicotinamide mononucleotide transporter [Clostridia bacterium]|nr:nicotinamide mononucleotide transporter [Clostridia bacterium]